MASEKNLDILVSVGGLIYELESAANKHGATIYNICRRDNGWAIEWRENYEYSLVIYQYYATLEEMVKGEFERLGKESEK